MPYQNNNNRLNPKAEGLTAITPLAQNVNQQIQVRPDLTEANRFINTANALASLGRGVVDVDRMLKREADISAMDLIQQDKLIGNDKHNWEIASKNLSGLGKYNPYKRDSYKEKSAKFIAQGLINELGQDPDFYKRTEAEYTQRLNEVRNNYQSWLKENKIPVRLAAGALESMESSLYKMQGAYIEKHAEYLQAQDRGIRNNDTVSQIRQISATLKSGENLQTAISPILQNHIQNASSLGIVDDEILKDEIIPILTTYLKTSSEEVSLSEVQNIVHALKVNNKTLADIVPDIDYRVKQLHKTISRERLTELEEANKAREKAIQENYDKAQYDLGQFLYENPNITEEQLRAKGRELAQTYNVPQYIDELYTIAHKLAPEDESPVKRVSDEATMLDLTTKLIDGTLTQEDITNALKVGAITTSDGRSLYRDYESKIVNKEKKETEAVNKAFNSDISKWNSNLKNKTWVEAQGKNFDKLGTVRAVSTIQQKVQAGELSPTEGRKQLANLASANTRIAQISTKYDKIPNMYKPTSGAYLKSKRGTLQVETDEAAERAAEALGILYNPNNGKRVKTKDRKKGIVSSTVTPYRTDVESREGKAHFATDFTAGDIHTPLQCGGTVVNKGWEESTGNFITLRLDNGLLMTVEHIQGNEAFKSVKNGKYITAGGYIASNGKTQHDLGIYTTGESTHIVFIDPESNNVLNLTQTKKLIDKWTNSNKSKKKEK